MSKRDEALVTLVYQAADALAEGALNAGEGREFLLANGWTEVEIEQGIIREISQQDVD